MPSFIEKVGNLFKKQETYKPSKAKKAGAKKPDPKQKQEPQQGDAPRKRKPQNQRNRPPQKKQGSRPQQKREQKPRPPKQPAKPWDPASFQVEPEEGKTRFQDLDLPNDILHAIADLNFKYCTPIQAEILPLTLASKDMAGNAQTGTGKTAAFLLGILTQFARNVNEPPKIGHPRTLILAPTRELAM